MDNIKMPLDDFIFLSHKTEFQKEIWKNSVDESLAIIEVEFTSTKGLKGIMSFSEEKKYQNIEHLAKSMRVYIRNAPALFLSAKSIKTPWNEHFIVDKSSINFI